MSLLTGPSTLVDISISDGFDGCNDLKTLKLTWDNGHELLVPIEARSPEEVTYSLCLAGAMTGDAKRIGDIL